MKETAWNRPWRTTSTGPFRTGWVLVPALLFATALFAGAGDVEAGEISNTFLRAEYLVLGAEASGSTNAILAADDKKDEKKPGRRGDEFGWNEPDESSDGDGPRNLGKKVKASLLSAALPGAGQWYVGNRPRAYLMGGIEVGIWGAYVIFDQMGDSWKDSAVDYAMVYAGTSGSHNDAYWINVGSYMDSDRFDDDRNREARALQEPYPVIPTTEADSWQWVNNQRRADFWNLWGDAHSSYDRRDYMLVFALVNRVVSMVDAVLGVDKMDGSLESSFMGLDLELAVVPQLPDPGARWTVTRRF